MLDAIVARDDGWLYARMSDVLTDDPIIRHRFFPLGIRAQRLWDLKGLRPPIPVTYQNDGLYRASDGLQFRLECGGQTLATVTEDEPVPPPPARGKPQRWHNGRWQRQLRTGWTP